MKVFITYCFRFCAGLGLAGLGLGLLAAAALPAQALERPRERVVLTEGVSPGREGTDSLIILTVD